MKLKRNVFIQEYIPGSPETPWSSSSDEFAQPDPNFIVSRTNDGKDVTFFWQSQWKLHWLTETLKSRDTLLLVSKEEPYTPANIANIDQSKSIILAIIKHSYKAADTPLGYASINRFNILLIKIRKYCEIEKITLRKALSDATHVDKIYTKHLGSSKSKPGDFENLLKKLSGLPLRYLGFKPALVRARKIKTRPQKPYSQTSIIPTRIYLQLINNYKATLEEFALHYEAIRQFSFNASQNKSYARNRRKRNSFPDCAKILGLALYFQQHNVNSVRDLSRHLGKIQYCCIMLIHAFTGMRNSEAYSIRGNSLERIEDKTTGVIKRRFIHGVVSKFRRKPTPTKWVTSTDIELPFASACGIAELIYNIHGIDFSDQPIFIATSYLPFSSGFAPPDTLNTPEPIWGNFEPRNYEHWFATPLISAADVNELESVTPTRLWRAEEEYSVGRAWPLTIHQLRRSTAVYAIRSGLVSLPALKMMLKHITIEMTVYYSRGSTFAPDLLKEADGDNEAFVNVYQSAELQVRAWQYANEFILTDEVLHGPHGLWLRGKAKDSSKSIPYAELLDDTLKRMRRGELHYQPTPVGGCTSGEVCHKRISVNFLGCDGCKSAAIKPSKVLKLIEVQKVLVSHCDVDSPERNAENQTLFELTEFAQTMGISA